MSEQFCDGRKKREAGEKEFEWMLRRASEHLMRQRQAETAKKCSVSSLWALPWLG